MTVTYDVQYTANISLQNEPSNCHGDITQPVFSVCLNLLVLGHSGVGTNIQEYQTVFSLTAKLMGGVLDLPTATEVPCNSPGVYCW